jgi:hypothetical protein
MEIEQNGNNELNTNRRAFVLFCRDSPPEQHKAAERLGCHSYYPIWVKRKVGQSVCPFCGKKTRWSVKHNTSHSAAVTQGPLLDRATAIVVANRLNEQTKPAQPAILVKKADSWWGDE